MAVLMAEGRQSFEDSAGQPLVGGKLYTYSAGTSSPKTTWADAGQVSPNTNPIILDGRGEATIFWDGSYKVVLTDANGVVIWTVDNVTTPDEAGSAAALREELLDFSFNPRFDSVQAGGNPAPFSSFSYYSDATITEHAYYGFVENGTVAYAGGAPIYGHASFNDNIHFIGGVNSDHHHSFQSYPHYGTAATIGVLSSFWSQQDITAGTVNEASGLKFNNPSGAGTIVSLYGVLIDSLTRGTNNYGIFSKTPTSYLGKTIQLGTAVDGVVYTSIEYASNGFLTFTPRATYGVRIQGAAGERKLHLGPTGAVTSDDSVIEQLGDGRTSITPRPTYGILLAGTVEITGSLVMSAPIVLASYTVATLPSAAANTRGLASVSDASAGAYNAPVVGGGALRISVFCDGASWRLA